jgi:nucleoside-diphosphate-sugar epimerase
MKKILIIGGGGYVGNVISYHFLKLNYIVNVLDNFIYDNSFSICSLMGDPNYNFFYGEFSDHKKLEEVSKGVNNVLILAGLVGDPITKKYPELSKKINDLGVKKCIDFFDKKLIDKLIFISTCSNYGIIKDGELANENYELKPLSLYAKAKVSNEKYLLSKKDKTGYSGVILRFATAFGISPRMRFDLTVSQFTRDLFFREKLVVFDEHTWRPYCHVRDFARLIETVINSENNKVHFEVFNAGGEKNNYTKKMILDVISSKIINCEIEYNQNDSDPRNYKVDFNKVKKVLDFSPNYSIEMGVEELISAFKFGLFGESIKYKNQYGNYSIKNKSI